MVKPYTYILLAVDLREESGVVAERAVNLANAADARVGLLHVVEFIPVDPAGEAFMPPPVDIEKELLENARRRLKQLAEDVGLADAECWVAVGSIKNEITRAATENEADLIVLGSHERHGLALLWGSTEKSLMHAAPCDVLTVRLKDTPRSQSQD